MPQRFTIFTDASILLIRLLVALVFTTSGLSHIRHSKARSQDLELSEGFTRFLGVGEVAGGVAVALGTLIQPAAAGLVLIMLGAIHRKIFVWHIGFWGEKNSGWHYDTLLVAMNLVIIASRGGRFVIW